MRIGFACIALYIAWGLRNMILPYEGYDPEKAKSLATWFDIQFMANDALIFKLQSLFVALMVLWVLQVVPLLTSLGMLIIFSLGGAFYYSAAGGDKPHHLQIIAYVLIGQLLASIVHICKERNWNAFLFPGAETLSGFWKPSAYRDRCVFYGMQMLAAVYVITGLTKFVRSEWQWIQDVPNLVVQFEKTLQMGYYNTLEPPKEDVMRWTADFMNEHPLLGTIAFGGALLLETFAFLALFNRWMMLFIGIGILVLHQSIGVVMNLQFLAHEVIVLLLFVNLPFWIVAIAKKLQGKPVSLA